jgi:hypothetical protein
MIAESHRVADRPLTVAREMARSLVPPHWGRGWQFSSRPISEDPMPRYKCKSIAALQIALGGLPDKMRVEVDPNIRVSAKTVGELRKMTAWAENLAITTPQERHAESAVKVSKASVATRVSPKP